jgi:hypothetical protein
MSFSEIATIPDCSLFHWTGMDKYEVASSYNTGSESIHYLLEMQLQVFIFSNYCRFLAHILELLSNLIFALTQHKTVSNNAISGFTTIYDVDDPHYILLVP